MAGCPRVFIFAGIASVLIATQVEAQPQSNEAGAVTAPTRGQPSPAGGALLYSCNYVTGRKLCGVETFTRTGANATMFDSTGRLTFAPNNLLVYSNTFSNPAWSHAAAKIAPAVKADPFGGKAGWSMRSTAKKGSYYRQAVKVEPGLNYLNTLYLAPGAASWAQIDRYDGSSHPSWINLSSCTAGTTAPGTTLTVTAVSGGWCKVDQAFAPASATVYPGFAPASGDNGGPAIGSSIHIFGEQLSLVTYQTTSADYYPTSESPYYGPRFGYAYNGSAWVPAGLMLEDARQNQLQYSNDLTNPVWVPGATMKVARDQMGVDGVVNGASSLTGGADSATNTICQAAKAWFHERIFSAYVKRINGSGVVNMATDAQTMAGTKATWRTMTITPEWTRVSFVQPGITDPITCFQITTPGDKIAVQYVQNENVPNETRPLGATSPIATTSSLVVRGDEMLVSENPILLQAKAFVVETSGQLPATDMALLGLTSARDELAIGLGEDTDNTLYSTFSFPKLSTTNTAIWSGTNRAGVAWGDEPVWNALSLNGGPVAAGDGEHGVLTKIFWGSEPFGGKACNCFIRSWAAYSSLTKEQLSAKSVVGAPF